MSTPFNGVAPAPQSAPPAGALIKESSDQAFKADVIDAAIIPDKVDGRWPSDHFPVTATVTFR